LQFKGSTEVLGAAVFNKLSGEKIVAGVHYFSDDTTPVFDFRGADGRNDPALFIGKKADAVPAPNYSVKGIDNKGDGAVPWLKLDAVTGSVDFKEAYRMITAGGLPPTDCAGQKDTFEVDYAAEYWFYK
jgi:Protein of unknown function (DUF3455)